MTGRMTIVALALALAGCGTVRPEAFENRIACMLGEDGAVVVSMWGPVGVASKIAPRDARRVCSE